MNLAEVENRTGELDLDQGFDLIYDLLLAYGLPRAAVTRVKNGSYNKSDYDHEVLWKGKVFYRMESQVSDDALLGLIEETRTDDRIARFKPRFLIIRNDGHLVARDQVTGDTLDIDLSDLPGRSEFFLPWAGIEKTQVENANIADVKAAEKMAKLYDEIVRHNDISSAEDTYNLNVFFSRLLFCFFAEDTGVFPLSQFTRAIANLTQDSGEDTSQFLERLFLVLDTEPNERPADLPGYLSDFGYVNGSLFSQELPCPTFTAKARALVLDCGTLDWAQINPDIFGSMIQAVVHPGERAGLGMHYTSVENIMKVIRPLFLDALDEEYAKVEDSPRKLRDLLDRISKIQVFDPACGSGNFLVISYKELRKLEHRILGRLADLEPHTARMFEFSRVNLENFHGIEIDGFAHEIAMLSLWLAKHQMNLEFEQLFGVELGLIPLKEGGQITHGNALQIEWESAFSNLDDGELFICGNPPYLGSRLQSREQKADLKPHHPKAKNLDYVSGWIVQAARLVRQGYAAAAGLVVTNSMTQGEQVGIMWPSVLEGDIEIRFAHTTFRWTNEARSNAGVSCVILGLAPSSAAPKRLFSKGSVRYADVISPYLVVGNETTVERSSKPKSAALPTMSYGCLLNDGGALIMSEHEREELVEADLRAEEFVKPFLGGREFLNGGQRWCLLIPDDGIAKARSIPEISNRLELVTEHRAKSSERSTRALAEHPNRFYFSCYKPEQAIVVPATSSERREYIPMGFLAEDTVVSNAVNVIYGAEPWVFGLIQSRMHMAWVRAVAGRLESRYRYSTALVYNTFPVPDLTDADKAKLQEGAVAVLAAREQFSGNTLAELYDPDKMPNPLREAHQKLDEIVDRIYRKKPFDSDEERLELLFAMYSEMTSEESADA